MRYKDKKVEIRFIIEGVDTYTKYGDDIIEDSSEFKCVKDGSVVNVLYEKFGVGIDDEVRRYIMRETSK